MNKCLNAHTEKNLLKSAQEKCNERMTVITNFYTTLRQQIN